MSDSRQWQEFGIFRTRGYAGGAAVKLAVALAFFTPWTDASAWWKVGLLLPFDSLILWQLVRYFPTKPRKLLLYYWWSPALMLVAYMGGTAGLVASALFFLGVSSIVREALILGGVFVLIASLIQPELWLAIPILLIFVYKKRLPMRTRLIAGVSLSGAALILVAIAQTVTTDYLDSATRACAGILGSLPVFATPETPIYLGSAALLGCLIRFASFRKTNREILILYSGVTVTLFSILVPSDPPLLLLALPFFVYLFVGNPGLARLPFYALITAICCYAILHDPTAQEWLSGVGAGTVTTRIAPTLLVATFVPAILLMLEYGARRNEVLRRSEQPLLVGIAGDSASGKHTLLKIVQALVGEDQCASIFGDDFHKWERGDQNWKMHTHLDPRANRLHDGADVALALRAGDPVEIAHYDHTTGRFTEPRLIEPRKFICFVGLHPFFLARMRDLIDVKIFVDIDESLRRNRKIRRDVIKRGHTVEEVIEQIESRNDDHEQFIGPQKEYADLVIRYDPLSPIESYTDAEMDVEVRTTYRMSNSIDLEELVSRLREIPTLSVQHFSSIEDQDLQVSGTLTLDQVVDVASELRFNFDELHIDPNSWVKRWIAGHNGISQLVFLHVYNHRMKAPMR